MYHNKEGALIRIEHAHKYTFFRTYVHTYVKAVMWDIHD